MKNYILLCICFSIVLISCDNYKDDSTEVSPLSEKKSSEDEPVALNTNTSNESFKKIIIEKMTNEKDVKGLDSLLTKLDKKGITFCQFVQRLFILDDSCYSVAKKKFPNPEDQPAFSKIHDDAIEIAQSNYLKSLHLTEHDASFATVAYSFDENIKQFCGKY